MTQKLKVGFIILFCKYKERIKQFSDLMKFIMLRNDKAGIQSKAYNTSKTCRQLMSYALTPQTLKKIRFKRGTISC